MTLTSILYVHLTQQEPEGAQHEMADKKNEVKKFLKKLKINSHVIQQFHL